MCRNIRTLHNFEPPATAEECHDSALQYVRKISGMNKPSAANAAAFDHAVETIAAVTRGSSPSWSRTRRHGSRGRSGKGARPLGGAVRHPSLTWLRRRRATNVTPAAE